MIKVTFFRKGGLIEAFKIEGHAETAEYGEDLVCAAVSGISQSVLLGLQVHLQKEMDWSIDEKDGRMKMKLLSEIDQETEAVLQAMLLGLREISREHPKAIQIFEK